MGSFPHTSGYASNEQCRLSLLDNEERPCAHDKTKSPLECVAHCDRESNTRNPDIITAPWMLKVPPPASHPTKERWKPFQKFLHFCESTILNLLFYTCLPVSTALFLVSLFPRTFAKVILSLLHNDRIQLLHGPRVLGSTENSVNTVLLVCRGVCDIDRIKDHMGALINARSPSTGIRALCHLQKRVVKKYGYLCLNNCALTFDINNHIKQFDTTLTKDGRIGYNDILSYLESTYDEPFENDPYTPQWEMKVVPSIKAEEFNLCPSKSDQCKKLYAIIFRYHNGIMNWTMFQEMLAKHMGRTKGNIKASFCPDAREMGLWRKVQSMVSGLVYGPPAILRNLFRKWTEFAGMKRIKDNPVTSFAACKAISLESMKDIKNKTYTGTDSILGSCIRIALRNLVLGQNMEFPRNLNVARTFHINSCSPPQVDTFTTNYAKFRNCVERLHASFHDIDKNNVCLGGRRSFNKLVLLGAGWLPYRISAWLHKVLVKADLLFEVCPCSNEPYELFNNDIVEDIYVWPDLRGLDANFKVTVTDYCNCVRANVVGKLGELSGGLTDAQIISNEFEIEYEHLASAVGMYPHQLYPSLMLGS